MKDTLISLDILWLDKDFYIVHSVTAPPCELNGEDTKDCPNYESPMPADYVLEIKAGSMEYVGLETGDELSRM